MAEASKDVVTAPSGDAGALDLEAIRAAAKRAPGCAVALQVPALLAEVERLRAALGAALAHQEAERVAALTMQEQRDAARSLLRDVLRRARAGEGRNERR